MSYTIPEPEQPAQAVVATAFEYNAWANLRLLDFCAGLSGDQLVASTVGGYGMLIETLGHMIYAEVDYVSRVTGKLPANPPPAGPATFDVLRDAVRWANEELVKLALAARSDSMVIE